MKAKTLLEHLRQIWPEAVAEDPRQLVEDRPLLPRHVELLSRTIDGMEQKEIFAFTKKGITITELVSESKNFLRENGLEISPPPPLPGLMHGLAESEGREQCVLAFSGPRQSEGSGFRRAGEVFHFIYYPEFSLAIVYSYFGEIKWCPQ